MKTAQKQFAVAPMMDWTDRDCRAFHRVLTRHALLYTEMVTAPAVIHGDREHLIGFDPVEHPVALQLGGSNPRELAEAARIGTGFGYDEINLNCGCPSDRVQSGRFGACLMAEPELVGRCFEAMKSAVDVPVTIKCRIGIDDQDEDADLDRFIDVVAKAGCRRFIVHARKAWLEGLSPKENREIPPLNYARVFRLKHRRPDLTIVLNGGIGSLQEAMIHLDACDGIMLGRAAYQRPWNLADVDRSVFNAPNPVSSRFEAVDAFMPHIGRRLAEGIHLSRVTRHMIGLFHGEPGGRAWRRHLSEQAVKPGAGASVVRQALELVQAARDERQTREFAEV